MIRDVFAVQKICAYKGHTIRVQKTSLIYRMQYSLIVDGVKQDHMEGLYGTFSLFGAINDGDAVMPVEVIIEQGFFKGTYYCRIENRTIKMKTYKIEGI